MAQRRMLKMRESVALAIAYRMIRTSDSSEDWHDTRELSAVTETLLNSHSIPTRTTGETLKGLLEWHYSNCTSRMHNPMGEC